MKIECQPHPEGGKNHNYIFCHCDIHTERQRCEGMEKEIERLRKIVADGPKEIDIAWLGHHSCVILLDKITKENESLQKRVKELEDLLNDKK